MIYFIIILTLELLSMVTQNKIIKNRTITSDNIRQPFIPGRNITNKEPSATIKNVTINL